MHPSKQHFLFVLVLTFIVESQVLTPVSNCLGNCVHCAPNDLALCKGTLPCEWGYYMNATNGICVLNPAKHVLWGQLGQRNAKSTLPVAESWGASTKQSICEYNSATGKKYIDVLGLFGGVSTLEKKFDINSKSAMLQLSFNLIRTEWMPFNDFLLIDVSSKDDTVVSLQVSFQKIIKVESQSTVILCQNKRVLSQKFIIKIENNNHLGNTITVAFTGFLYNSLWAISNLKLLSACTHFSLFDNRTESCSICDADSYLVTQDSENYCEKCPSLCSRCTSSTNCSACLGGATLENGSCLFGGKFKTQEVVLWSGKQTCLKYSYYVFHSSQKISFPEIKNENGELYDQIQLGFQLYYSPSDWPAGTTDTISIQVNKVEVHSLSAAHLPNKGTVTCAPKTNPLAIIQILTPPKMHIDNSATIEFHLFSKNKQIRVGVSDLFIKSVKKEVLPPPPNATKDDDLTKPNETNKQIPSNVSKPDDASVPLNTAQANTNVPNITDLNKPNNTDPNNLDDSVSKDLNPPSLPQQQKTNSTHSSPNNTNSPPINTNPNAIANNTPSTNNVTESTADPTPNIATPHPPSLPEDTTPSGPSITDPTTTPTSGSNSAPSINKADVGDTEDSAKTQRENITSQAQHPSAQSNQTQNNDGPPISNGQDNASTDRVVSIEPVPSTTTSYIPTSNQEQSGLHIVISQAPSIDNSRLTASIDKLAPQSYQVKDTHTINNDIHIFLAINSSFVDGTIIIYKESTSRLLQSGKKPLAALKVIRFDALSPSQLSSISAFSTLFQIFAWIAVILIIVAVLLGYGIIMEQYVINLQLLFLHAYIAAEYLPLTFREVVGGLNIIQNLNYFIPQHGDSIQQSWLGNVLQNGPLRFIAFNADINFTRQFYPIIIINIVYLLWFILLVITQKWVLRKDLIDQEKPFFYRVIDNIVNRPINYLDQIWRYQFLATVWVCFIQFYNLEYPEGSNRSQLINSMLCIISFICTLGWPLFIGFYCHKYYYQNQYSDYLYKFEDIYYRKIPAYFLPSKHHRVAYPIVRCAKLFMAALVIAYLGNIASLTLLLLIGIQIIEVGFAKFHEIYSDNKYFGHKVIQNGVFALIELILFFLCNFSSLALTESYVYIGFILSGMCLIIVLNGLARAGDLAAHKYREMFEELEWQDCERQPKTERVV